MGFLFQLFGRLGLLKYRKDDRVFGVYEFFGEQTIVAEIFARETVT